MKEVIRTNDPVTLSFARSLLEESGIESLLLDQHTSILEGSIGAIQQRLVVGDDNYLAARKLLAEEGLVDLSLNKLD